MVDPVYIIPDNPVIVPDTSDKKEEEKADFGFSAYIDTIASLIANKIKEVKPLPPHTLYSGLSIYVIKS